VSWRLWLMRLTPLISAIVATCTGVSSLRYVYVPVCVCGYMYRRLLSTVCLCTRVSSLPYVYLICVCVCVCVYVRLRFLSTVCVCVCVCACVYRRRRLLSTVCECMCVCVWLHIRECVSPLYAMCVCVYMWDCVSSLRYVRVRVCVCVCAHVYGTNLFIFRDCGYMYETAYETCMKRRLSSLHYIYLYVYVYVCVCVCVYIDMRETCRMSVTVATCCQDTSCLLSTL